MVVLLGWFCLGDSAWVLLVGCFYLGGFGRVILLGWLWLGDSGWGVLVG